MIRCTLPLALLLAASLLAGCGPRRSGKARAAEVERLPRLETILLGKPARIAAVRSYTATVDAMEKAELCAMVKGLVKYVPPDLDIGRFVKKDEVLLALEVPDLVADRDNKKALVEQSISAEAQAAQAVLVADAEVKEAKALVKRYEAEQEFRKLQLARVTRLVQGETLNQQLAEESQLQFNAASSALAAGQAQVTTKEARLLAAAKEKQVAAARVKAAEADLERSDVQVRFATIKAPFDGVITKRWIDSGAMIKDAATPLFTCMRIDKVRVIIDLPERDAPFLRAGDQGNKVELEVPALHERAGSARLQGTITLLSSALDPVTRTMRAEIHVANQNGDQRGVLMPQMTGTAHVTLGVRDALTVPATALVRSGNKTGINIVADPTGDPMIGTVKFLEVTLGLDDGLRVEIRNDRLTGKELVLVKGASVVRTGDRIIAIPAK